MSKDKIINELEAAIADKKEAEKRIAIARIRLKYGTQELRVPTTQLSHEIKSQPKPKSEIDLFILAHADLEPEDIEFLRLEQATTQQVADYLTENQIHETTPATVSRQIGKRYSPGKSDSNWKRMVNTVSVVRHHFYRDQYGKTQAKQERNMDTAHHPQRKKKTLDPGQD
jgi:hypothetical protein